ncbi:sigma-70 family RNA polymerase sigma factor [Candidatus Gracilibacteria bacterium]|nr:sigma-70 family RNA polymerase sigma factor [Candidatus Gracilibacteria bacterium]
MIKLKDRKLEIENLVVQVQAGDQDAFAALYEILIDPIYRYIYYRVPATESEDLTETVFLKVWKNINKYRPMKNIFTAWVFRIAHNLVVDYYRAAKNKKVDELSEMLPDMDRQHNPIVRTKQSMDKDTLKKALARMKDSYREIIIYKFMNELSNSEIALILNKSEGSLRILQFRALKSLKKELQDMGIDYMA